MVSWIPAASRPRKAGWKSASGERKLEEDQWVEREGRVVGQTVHSQW